MHEHLHPLITLSLLQYLCSCHEHPSLPQTQLEATPCVEQTIPLSVAPGGDGGFYSLWHMYERYWRPFGELLTDMEREGMLVNRYT